MMAAAMEAQLMCGMGVDRPTNWFAWSSVTSLCLRCGWFPEAYVKPLEDARDMEEPPVR